MISHSLGLEEAKQLWTSPRACLKPRSHKGGRSFRVWCMSRQRVFFMSFRFPLRFPTLTRMNRKLQGCRRFSTNCEPIMCMKSPRTLGIACKICKQTDDRRYRSLNRCYGKVAVNPRVEWKHRCLSLFIHMSIMCSWEFPNQAEAAVTDGFKFDHVENLLYSKVNCS